MNEQLCGGALLVGTMLAPLGKRTGGTRKRPRMTNTRASPALPCRRLTPRAATSGVIGTRARFALCRAGEEKLVGKQILWGGIFARGTLKRVPLEEPAPPAPEARALVG
jgi:hypothetical protein